jgi:hypothetical protein
MDLVGMTEGYVLDPQVVSHAKFAIAQKAAQSFGIDGH